MAVAFRPTLRLYRVSPLWGIALPAIAFCYTLFTLDSALQFARGRGGLWKGRVQAAGPRSCDRVNSGRHMMTADPGASHRPTRAPPPCDPANRTMTRTFRSPRTSFIRATALPFWRSMSSSGRPTTSPITPRLPSARSSSTSIGSKPAFSARTTRSQWRCSCERNCRSEAYSPARPGPLDGVPNGCDQAAISRLGRLDALLQLLGHAGGSICVRRAWRGPLGLARQRCAVRRTADHQPFAGLRLRLPQSRTGSMCRWTRSSPPGPPSMISAATRVRRPARLPARPCRTHRHPARPERRVLVAHRRFPPGHGGRSHPGAGAPAGRHPAPSRSFERARSAQGFRRPACRGLAGLLAGTFGRMERMIAPVSNSDRA